MVLRLEIDGAPGTPRGLAELALNPYGHFTAMQVRGGRVRGLDLHLDRLDGANRELFGAPLDGGHVRTLIRHAISAQPGDEHGHGAGAYPDASVRVIVLGIAGTGTIRVVVTVRAAGQLPAAPQRLKSVPYQREIAHIKRPSDFAHAYHLNQVARAGYDEALLTAPDGRIAEGGITNIGFLFGDAVIWPDAPHLAGITMQLIAPRLAEQGLTSKTDRVTLADLPRFAGACVTNSRGVAAVRTVDELELPISDRLMTAVHAAYDSVPWDAI